jgi:hypothetical protein
VSLPPADPRVSPAFATGGWTLVLMPLAAAPLSPTTGGGVAGAAIGSAGDNTI